MHIPEENIAGHAPSDGGGETISANRPNDHQTNVLRVLQSRAETRKFYDKISGAYDLLAEKSEAPVRRAGLEKLSPQPGECMLEIGFGTGHCLAAIALAVGPAGQVCGLDISEGMRQRAVANLQREHVRERVRLACGDAVRLPYAANVFDGVFVSFTLELLDTPEIPLVLAECRRVLRGGGRMVVVGMSKEGKPDLVLRLFEWTHKHFPNFLDCRPIFVRRALADADFTITDVRVAHMWVPVEIVTATKA